MIYLPASKSIGARFLVATYFAGTLPADPFFEDNDDLMLLQEALLEVYSDEEPIDYGDSPIDVGASGTALRFVTAVCASCPGADYVITGTPRLMNRPMAPLMQLLKDAGAGIETFGENGSGPYRVTGKKLSGGDFSIRGDISSQFISALMLVAPSWEKGLKLTFTTPTVSRPYLEMTASVMKKFGIKVNLTDTFVEVPHSTYIDNSNFKVEADWSSASFFFEAAALGAKDVAMADLLPPASSLQGDSVAENLFSLLGVKASFNKEGVTLIGGIDPTSEKIEVDFRSCPDLMLPFAVACLCTDTKFRFTGIENLRLKESDRVESLKEEAAKLGFVVETDDASMEWNGKKCDAQDNPLIKTHEDHRVAMAFAMAAFKFKSIRIENPGVVEKSFINFWNQLPRIGLTCSADNNIMTVKL